MLTTFKFVDVAQSEVYPDVSSPVRGWMTHGRISIKQENTRYRISVTLTVSIESRVDIYVANNASGVIRITL